MRYRPSRDPSRRLDPNSRYSIAYTLAGSALAAIVAVATVLAVFYPATATGAVALLVAGLLAVRTVRRFYRARRRDGRTRRVCVPKTGVCVEL